MRILGLASGCRLANDDTGSAVAPSAGAEDHCPTIGLAFFQVVEPDFVDSGRGAAQILYLRNYSAARSERPGTTRADCAAARA